jgi:hypothetical protein
MMMATFSMTQVPFREGAERCRIVADIACTLIGRDVNTRRSLSPRWDRLATVTTEAPQWHHRQRGRIPDEPTGPYLGTATVLMTR